MNTFDSIRKRTAIFLVGCFAMAFSALASTNVVLWDVPRKGTARKVPSNLMELEKDPLKSASDPGYYGRDYVFTFDVAVENAVVRAYVSRLNGHVTVQTPTRPIDQPMPAPQTDDFATSDTTHGICFGQIIPATSKRPVGIELIRNAADEVVLRVDYGERDTVTYSFGKNEIIEVKPAGEIKSVTIEYGSEYVIAPGFVGDDLIFKTEEASGGKLSIPADNMIVGLRPGSHANVAVVVTWPGKHNVIVPKKYSLEVETGGDPVFVAALAAPGIWHREKLGADFLEQDKTLGWKSPFTARWKTELMEGNGRTTYAFRHGKGTVWRGVAGSYNYPVWFDGETANFSLSKKVPPKGEAVIYFLEGDDTPSSVLTPVDVLKETLGRPAAAAILDVEGRKLRTHHGASGSNVHRACTCGYTEAIQAVFEKGEESDKREFVDQSIQDMKYFVRAHLARIDEYRAFATNLNEYLQATAKSNPELKEYLDDLDQTVQQIPAEYENQKENMKSLAYAAELEEKTMALTGRKEAQNLKRYMELLKAWRGMGGAQDGVVAQYHILARKLFQDAGYNVAAIGSPKALDVAREIRTRCKEVLRSPDGYEIWPNY
jgi:hypothetical protein